MSKKLFAFILTASLISLGLALNSCNKASQGMDPDSAQAGQQESPDQLFWNIVGQLVGMDKVTPDYQGKTFQPVIGEEVEPDDIVEIMLGRQSARLPQVIHPTASSDVFFFWSGHGAYRDGPLWGDEDSYTYFGTERLQEMVTEMNEADMYRRMMFSVETCFSGKWGKALEGIPDVLVLTAASPDETSKADVHDRDLGVYLSNAFARTFRRVINANPDVTIYDLYKELARTTTGSHVNIYNNAQYGSVYSETMREFFPE